jgi:Protein of unknown function (DUF3376)/Patatin-like phospholipase
VLQQSAPKDAELRLALGMRGGVSLAVWIGGACAEIDELGRAADEQRGFWWELLQESPYGRVAVDVMAGASAGGLNGVVFAAAIRHGFPMDRTMRVWRRVADVDVLRRKSEPWSSLFDGDARFLDVVHDELNALIGGSVLPEEQRTKQKEVQEQQERGGYVDLQLSATLVEPIDSGAISPGDETLRRSRSSARFHFRHDPSAVPERLDIEHTDVSRLAVAARGTASFPIAFDAAMVRATRPAVFEHRPSRAPGVELVADGSDDQRRIRQRLVDCRWAFSEGRGAAKESGTPFGDDDFTVADGGAVDNIPLGKALDGARDAPASGPTRRVLVYLHPTGPSGVAGLPKQDPSGEPAEERAVRRRNPVSVLSGLVASQVQSESIDGDLARLEDHNRTIRLARLLRQTLLTELVQLSTDRQAAATATDPITPIELAGRRLQGYLVQRAGADAEAIEALLADPLAVLGEDPFPLPPSAAGYTTPDDRWRSPIAGWTSDQRLALDTALRERFVERSGHRKFGMDVLLGGFGPVVRSIDLLLELAREGEKQDPARAEVIGRMKPPLYKLGSFVRELVRVRQLGWVCRAGCLDAQGDVSKWVESTLAELRMLDRDAEGVAALSEPAGPDFVTAARALLERRAADLQTLACGGSLPVRKADTDLRKALIAQLKAMAQPLLDQLPPVPVGPVDPYGPQARSGAEVIQRVLTDTSGDFTKRLASLEVLLLDEHLLGASGHVEIGFTRMSAAAPIIGADRFTQLHAYSLALDEARTREGNYLAPDVKLAGNELASFSAFLDEDWRVNDWTWGRIDATATLVDLLLGEDRPDRDAVAPDPDTLLRIAGPEAQELAGPVPEAPAEKRQHARRALTARRQSELLKLAADDGLPDDLGEWSAGLETLVNPGSPELSAAVTELGNVAAQVVAAVLPSRVPRIVGPLQGLLRVVTKRFSNPTGVLPDPVRAALMEAGVKSAQPEAKLGFPWLALVSVLVGIGLAALAYAAADNTVSLTIGLAVGLVVGLVPGAILLWLAVQPVRPRQQWPWFTTAVAVGLTLGAGLTAVVVAALRAWL